MPLRNTQRRLSGEADLNINSMMDMMTIILVFLLKSYATADVSLAPSDALRLPTSTAEKAPPAPAVNLVLSADGLVVDGQQILTLVETADGPAFPEDARRGQLVPVLYDVLSEKYEVAQDVAERVGSSEPLGRLFIQADREIPYSTLRAVLYTAGNARFGELQFVVYGRD